MDVVKRIRKLIGDMSTVTRATNKSAWAQLREIQELRKRCLYFGVDDYFDYRLFEDRLSPSEKTEFAGWRALYPLDRLFNRSDYEMILEDKILMYGLLDSIGLPIPSMLGLYTDSGRVSHLCATLHSPLELKAFLAEVSYPLFAKPVVGEGGAAGTGISSRLNDKLQLTSGKSISDEEFSAQLAERRPFVQSAAGYLFQGFVEQHPGLTALTNNPGISTARITILVIEGKVHFISAIWRIIHGENMVDNWHDGETGNLLGALDLETGSLERVVQYFGLRQEILDRHPGSGIEFKGFQLPFWKEALDIVSRGAMVVPMLRFQHWDIGFSSTGPIVLEVNTLGSIHFHQYANGRGIITPIMRKEIDKLNQS